MRYAALVGLVVTCLLVFLGVSELSRASGEDLDKSVSADLGQVGTYRLDLVQGLDLPIDAARRQVEQALRHYSAAGVETVVTLGTLNLSCPDQVSSANADSSGSATALVLLGGNAFESPPTQSQRQGGPHFCLSGVRIDGLARPTSEAETRGLGTAVILDPLLEHEGLMVADGPPSLSFVIRTGVIEDEGTQLQSAAQSSLAKMATLNGLDPQQTVAGVTRIDSGAATRRASDGIHLVYTIVEVAMLIVAAAGVLIVQSSTVRERRWFYGLTRSMGARAGDIFTMVLLDVCWVLAVSWLAVLGLGTLAQPVVASFARSAFDVSAQLIRTPVLLQLMGGSAVVLICAGVVPAWWAARLDPVDVLERR